MVIEVAVVVAVSVAPPEVTVVVTVLVTVSGSPDHPVSINDIIKIDAKTTNMNFFITFLLDF